MSGAIQRWYFVEDDDGSQYEERAEDGSGDEHHWCKARDVVQLEQLMTRYLEDLRYQRGQMASQKARIEFLEKQLWEESGGNAETRRQMVHLTDAYDALQKRYDILMQRNKPIIGD